MLMGIVLILLSILNGYNAIAMAQAGHAWVSLACAFACGFCAAASLVGFFHARE